VYCTSSGFYVVFLFVILNIKIKHILKFFVVYRILTIIALSHPITTPVFCSLILRDIKFKGYTLRDISSNLMPLQRISSRRSHYENRNAYDFDCKSHLDTDLDGIQIQSNTEQNYDGETGFINQRFIENDSRRKVMSTVWIYIYLYTGYAVSLGRCVLMSNNNEIFGRKQNNINYRYQPFKSPSDVANQLRNIAMSRTIKCVRLSRTGPYMHNIS
jgi:hypothetical protein